MIGIGYMREERCDLRDEVSFRILTGDYIEISRVVFILSPISQ